MTLPASMPQAALAAASSLGPVLMSWRLAQCLTGNDSARKAAKTIAMVVAPIRLKTSAPMTMVGQPNSSTRFATAQSVSLAYSAARLR